MDSQHKISNFQTNCTPSYIPNNLSSSKNSFFYIHNSESLPRVIVVDKALFEGKQNATVVPLNKSERNEMLCIKIVTLNSNNYVAIGLYGGFKLWSIDGTRLLYQILSKVKRSNRPYAFTSICEFQTKNSNFILCGDNYGQIFQVHGEGNTWKSKCLQKEGTEAVISISSAIGYNVIGVTYDSGKISLLKIEDNICKEMKSFKGEESMIALVSACIKSNNIYYFACGFINGEIKVYNMEKCMYEFSIASHLRNINAMIGVDEGIICGGDDGCVNIWKIWDEMVEIRQNYVFEDKMIVGLDFDKEKRNLYVIAYDFGEISVIYNVEF